MAGARHSRFVIRDALGLAMAALAVRVAWLLVNRSQLNADPDAYAEIARTLAETGVYGVRYGVLEPSVTAFRPPLYPWLLSWLVGSEGLALAGVACIHVAMGVATALGVWRLVWVYTKQRSVSLLAGGLVVVDPLLLSQSSQVMTETLAAFLVVAVWWAYVVYRRVGDSSTLGEPHSEQVSPEGALHLDWVSFASAVLLGVLLTLAYLCRPTFLVWAVLLIGGGTFMASPNQRAFRTSSVIALSVVVLAMGVWTLRNQRVFQRPIWATTHGGYTLLLGNNDWFYDNLMDRPWSWPWRRPSWQPDNFFAAYQERVAGSIQGECEQDDASKSWAMETMKRRPWAAAWASVHRVINLWNPFPATIPGRAPSLILLVGLFYCCKMAAVMLGLVRYRRCLLACWWWPVLSLALTLTAVHSLYWSNPRMRAPIAPMTAAVAALAFGAHAREDKRLDSWTNPSAAIA